MWDTRNFSKETNFNRKKEEYDEVLKSLTDAKNKEENPENILELVAQKMLFGIYENKKSGNKYVVSGVACDATNGREGDIIVTYFLEGSILDIKTIFAREMNEFCEKFERVGKANFKIGI